MTPNIAPLSWEPDSDPTTPGVLVDVENMVPTRNGYEPDKDLTNASLVTLTSPCFGAASHKPALIRTFAGTASAIYGDRLGTWVNMSRVAPYTVITFNYAWRFALFKDVSLAVQFDNTLQFTTDPTTTNFADVTGAPSADTIAVQRNFVLLGSYKAGLTLAVDGWICSALEDYTDWTPDIATQCASGRLTATPGPIVRLVAFQDYVIAFKPYSMYRGSYVGPTANTWSWPVVSHSVGFLSHDAVCEAEGVLYWLAMTGFYRWRGGEIERIANAPFEWVKNNVTTAFRPDSFLKAHCVFDEAKRLVRWTLVNHFSYEQDAVEVSLHVDTGKWSRSAKTNAQWSFARVLTTANSSPAYFVKSGTDYVLSKLGTSASASSVTTGDIGDDDVVRTMRRVRARYLTAPSTSSVTHYHRMNLGDSLTTGATVSRSGGKYDLSHAARWHRLKFAQTGSYEVTGYSIDPPESGKR